MTAGFKSTEGGILMRRLLALAGTCFGLVSLAWAVPAPNQGFIYINLQSKANHKLKDQFHDNAFTNNNLGSLPQGLQKFEGVPFKIGEKFVQLSGERLKTRPQKIEGIKVDKKFGQLHILHAAGWFAEEDALVGEYTIHYEDKTKETIPIVYGKDVRDWWYYKDSPGVSRSQVAWEGDNEGAKSAQGRIRLYLSTWKNPKPDKKVLSIDYSSKNTNAAPFCVAMTIEEKK